MSDKKPFYITTTLPYVNADPHIGFAMEIIQADIIARWKKSQGHEVFFNTGTDEHGQKVYQAAQKAGKDPQVYCDELALKFKELQPLLGLSDDLNFIRTTSEQHKKAAQEMWNRCKKGGYIEKKFYQIKYCTGCELEKTDSELVEGKCPLHPDRELEIREEENYFFKFSKFADQLRSLYEKEAFVIPDFRLNEMRALIDRGLEDFSISRLKEKLPWGIPVPDDEDHVMYVWFDALTSYISTLGWPSDKENFNKFWDGKNNIQIAGKDQVRQQAAMWQAMLIAAGLPSTAHIVIHGFLNISGQKMSKSVGNVINPKDMVERYGVEATRAMLAGVNQFEDTDVNMGVKDEGFDLAYATNLANGLGNLVSRILTMAEANLEKTVEIADKSVYPEFRSAMDEFNIQNGLNIIWQHVKELDLRIQKTEPFKLVKTDPEQANQIIVELVQSLARIGTMLETIMPNTAKIIADAIATNKKPENLFPRKD
jgi:methionyl-tRNA synthetase